MQNQNENRVEKYDVHVARQLDADAGAGVEVQSAIDLDQAQVQHREELVARLERLEFEALHHEKEQRRDRDHLDGEQDQLKYIFSHLEICGREAFELWRYVYYFWFKLFRALIFLDCFTIYFLYFLMFFAFCWFCNFIKCFK